MNAIVDVDAAGRAGWTPIDLAAAYVNGGARFLQIRAKTLSSAAFLELSSRVCGLAHAAGGIVVVNDRADVARLSGADGLHVGQDDLTVAAARALLGADAVIGLSTHTGAQFDAAIAQPVSYVAIGPVFGTASKATGYDAVGLGLIRRATAHQAVDIVAIGGVTLENAADAIAAGAASVAVISDLLATGDPEARVRAYLARLGESGGV